MRKILVFMLALLLVVGLVSCGAGSKIEYTDPSTGEKQEVVIQKTEDEKEVSQSLYAMTMTEKTAKNPTTSTVTASAKAKGDIKDVGSFDVSISEEMSLSYKGETAPATNIEAIKNIDAYVKVSVSGKIPGEDKEEVALGSSTIELYLEDGVAYAKIALDAKIADLMSAGSDTSASTGEMIKMFNDKTLKFDLTSTMREEQLDDETKEALEKMLNGKDVTIRDIIPEEELDEVKQAFDQLVETLHLTITNVSGTKVTYTADLKAAWEAEKDEASEGGVTFDGSGVAVMDELTEAKANLTIDVKDLSLVSASVNLKADGENKLDVSGNVNFKYSASVPTMSDSDKGNAVDLMSMMRGLFG